MKLTPILLVVAALLRPVAAWGCDTVQTPTSTCVAEDRGGKVWVSYPVDTAVALVKARDALAPTQAEAAALRKAVADMLTQRDLYVTALTQRQVALDDADRATRVAEERAAKAESANNPLLYLGIGAGTSAVLFGALAYVIFH